MRVYGIDFTSTPSRRKPLTCLACTFDDRLLRTETLEEWQDFSEFERALKRPGPCYRVARRPIMETDAMTPLEILDAAHERNAGYKVDASRGERICRASSERLSASG
ncbi:hypothetical protein [Methylocystis sp.]|uniref:hypothetical protein n=1 Tax=Methylocystis sp. TaxID=1911079 RepID=UPI003D0F0702